MTLRLTLLAVRRLNGLLITAMLAAGGAPFFAARADQQVRVDLTAQAHLVAWMVNEMDNRLAKSLRLPLLVSFLRSSLPTGSSAELRLLVAS